MPTHAIGRNTVNRTANIPVELDRALGQLSFQSDRSKSDYIRELVKWAVKKHLVLTRDAVVGLFFLGVTTWGLFQGADFLRTRPRLRRRDEQVEVVSV
jgi:hypothetical protein